jgi:hypothetical protein
MPDKTCPVKNMGQRKNIKTIGLKIRKSKNLLVVFLSVFFLSDRPKVIIFFKSAIILEITRLLARKLYY